MKYYLILATMIPLATAFVITENMALRAASFVVFVAVFYFVLAQLEKSKGKEEELKKTIFSLRGNMGKQKKKIEQLGFTNEALIEDAFECIKLEAIIHCLPMGATIGIENDKMVYRYGTFKAEKQFDELTSEFITRSVSDSLKAPEKKNVRNLN